jgi:hypothetical protein
VGTTSFACTATDAAQQKASCSSTVVVAAPSQPAPAPTQPAPAPAPTQPAPAPAPTQPAPEPAPTQPDPAPAPQPAPKPTPPGRDPERERDPRPTPPGRQPDPAPTSPAPQPGPAPEPTWPVPEPGAAPEPTWPLPDPGLYPELPTLPAGVVALLCPRIAPVKEEAQSGKAVVEFVDPIFSDGSVPVTVSCSPKSGSHFRIGTTTVACSATNAAGELFSCTTAVTVTDRPKLSNGGGS